MNCIMLHPNGMIRHNVTWYDMIWYDLDWWYKGWSKMNRRCLDDTSWELNMNFKLHLSVRKVIQKKNDVVGSKRGGVKGYIYIHKIPGNPGKIEDAVAAAGCDLRQLDCWCCWGLGFWELSIFLGFPAISCFFLEKPGLQPHHVYTPPPQHTSTILWVYELYNERNMNCANRAKSHDTSESRSLVLRWIQVILGAPVWTITVIVMTASPHEGCQILNQGSRMPSRATRQNGSATGSPGMQIERWHG